MHSPQIEHWEAATRMVHYLKSRFGQGILLSSSSPLLLIAYCDLDLDYCLSICNWILCLIGWFACFLEGKEEHTLIRSSTEYCSMTMTLAY